MRSKHFAKKFGQACGDFDIVNNDGVDTFLVPVDLDFPHQTLLHWIHYKTTKSPKHFKVVAVHFHTGEVKSEIVDHFTEYCENRKIAFHTKKVDNAPTTKDDYYKILADEAKSCGCNKIAIPESLDYLNALLLTTMSKKGLFSCPSPVQDFDGVLITRPFCYASDEDISKFGVGSKFQNTPSAISVREDPFMAVARRGITELISDYSNVRMNFFHAQFSVQQKYIGVGEDIELQEDADTV